MEQKQTADKEQLTMYFRGKAKAYVTGAEAFPEEEFWNLLCLYEGHPFRTVRGLAFFYTVKGYEIFIDRKEKSITKATVMRAVNRIIELRKSGKTPTGPKQLGVFGASYLFAILQYFGLMIEKPVFSMEQLVSYLIAHKQTIATMESCTGGLFASGITDTEGASEIFRGGFVTYSNEAKIMHGVPKEIIDTHGVYSIETAKAMACACQKAYDTAYGVGITGTTGNVDPANADSVCGMVYVAVAGKDEIAAKNIRIATEGLCRKEIKERIVTEVVQECCRLLCNPFLA